MQTSFVKTHNKRLSLKCCESDVYLSDDLCKVCYASLTLSSVAVAIYSPLLPLVLEAVLNA